MRGVRKREGENKNPEVNSVQAPLPRQNYTRKYRKDGRDESEEKG